MMKKKLITFSIAIIHFAGVFAQTSNTTLDTTFKLCSQITSVTNFYSNFPTPTPRNFNKVFTLPDGKILASGAFRATFGSESHKYLLRLNSDGSIDNTFSFLANSFASNQWGIVTKVIPVSGGSKYLVAGSFSQDPGTMLESKGIYRINADGTEDTAFNSLLVGGTGVDMNGVPAAGASAVYDMDVLPNGNIVIGGNFFAYGTDSINHIALLNPDGTFNNSFSSPLTKHTNDRVFRVRVLPDGKILVGASGSTLILKKNGELDTATNVAFGHYSSNSHCITLQPDGKIIVAGKFFALPNAPTGAIKIARFNSDFTLDNTFTILAGNEVANNIQLQADGKILLTGGFSQIGGQPRKSIARLNSDGTLDDTFDPGATGFNSTGQVYDVDLQADGKIVTIHSHTHHQGNILQSSNVSCFVIRLNGGQISTSVAEYLSENNSFNLYPNPATSEIILDLTNTSFIPSGIPVTVMDVQGRAVLEKTVAVNHSRLDVSTLPKGIYYVRISALDMPMVKKLIIQ